MDAIRIGIDLAKKVFSLHGASKNGKVVLRRTVSREKLVELPPRLRQGPSWRWPPGTSG